MTNDPLTVTRERVLAAAEACPQAAATLRTLFPEAFDPEPVRLAGTITERSNPWPVVVAPDNPLLSTDRLHLSSRFDWQLCQDPDTRTWYLKCTRRSR